MELLIDIGNTRTKLKGLERTVLASDASVSIDEIAVAITEAMQGQTPSAVIISSVVPDVTPIFQNYCENNYDIEVFTITPSHSRIQVPSQTGADIICCLNAVNEEAVIIMLGTATVFTYVSAENLVGVSIAPGVLTGMRSMIDNAALLGDFPIKKPDQVLGTNTIECLQSGMTYGHAAMIDGMIERINPSENARIVAMGGFAEIIIPLCRYDIEINQNLIYEGMLEIYRTHSQ